MDNSDDYFKAGFQVFKTLANNAGWQVLDVFGQGTAPEQISAVEDLITQKVDALVVVQNSPETTSECPKRAHAAGIGEFHLTYNPPNEPGLAGFAGFDWVYEGELAAKSAVTHVVSEQGSRSRLPDLLTVGGRASTLAGARRNRVELFLPPKSN